MSVLVPDEFDVAGGSGECGFGLGEDLGGEDGCGILPFWGSWDCTGGSVVVSVFHVLPEPMFVECCLEASKGEWWCHLSRLFSTCRVTVGRLGLQML